MLALLIVAACSGASTSTPPGPPIANRVVPSPTPWRCPAGGVTEQVDLDGDGHDDEVRMTPDPAAVTCLEIHATSAPPLLCRGSTGDAIIAFELTDGGAEIHGHVPCEPEGLAVRVIRPVPGDGEPRTFSVVFARDVIADAAPSGTALWFDGGDAYGAIVWRGAWRWFVVGA